MQHLFARALHGLRGGRFLLWSVVAVVGVSQAGLPLAMLAVRDRLIFFPAERPSTAEGLALFEGVDAALIEAPSSDGLKLSGYDIRPPGAADAPLLLFLHGNAGNAALRAPVLGRFASEAGIRVVLASYSGYGGNDGTPSEEHLYADALAFFDRLVDDRVDPRQIVLYGESIGGAAALRVASERSCGGVITQSTFTSLSSLARRAYPWLPLTAFLARNGFPNAERASRLDVPYVIVHGTADETVPFDEGERLHAVAARSELWPIAGAGHNDLLDVGGPSYARDIGHQVLEWGRSD